MAAATLTINEAMLHAIAFIKGPSAYASSEELHMANTVETIVSDFYLWHWTITAGTDIAITASTQDYSMAAGDQDNVSAFYRANLLDGSTESPDLWDQSEQGLPLTSTAGQPFAVALISPTQIRLFPDPDASYTFQWDYYAIPTVHTANSESFDAPLSFNEAVKAGMIWQVLAYADDDRDQEWKDTFFRLLQERKRREQVLVGRRRQ